MLSSIEKFLHVVHAVVYDVSGYSSMTGAERGVHRLPPTSTCFGYGIFAQWDIIAGTQRLSDLEVARKARFPVPCAARLGACILEASLRSHKAWSFAGGDRLAKVKGCVADITNTSRRGLV